MQNASMQLFFAGELLLLSLVLAAGHNTPADTRPGLQGVLVAALLFESITLALHTHQYGCEP